MRPIEAARHEIEDLVEGILDALEATHGALPLLQFTAARLWEMRDRKAAHAGELRGARRRGRRAGQPRRHAPGRDERAPGEAVERLVTPERTCAVASLGELCELPGDPVAIERVVGLLADGRLLAIERGSDRAGGTVEIVHESLIERWPTLKRWLDESEEDARLRAAARLWDSSHRAAGMLWRGKVAEEARGFRRRYRREMPERERLFLEEVVRLADDHRQRRRRRLVTGVIAALLLLMVSGMGFVKATHQNWLIMGQNENMWRAIASAAEARSAADKARRESEAQLVVAELMLRDAVEDRERAEAEVERARLAAIEARKAEVKARKVVEEAAQRRRMRSGPYEIATER
ncbi:hypothetical protein BE20_14105 [Sorangium cellulosum]|nr:hypothetical protein BE20_14105 [Sorangium cellulosum]